MIAVPHNIIGPRQKWDDPFRNVASIMINLMMQGRQPIIYGTGKQRRCFSFIDDCLYCLKEMAFRQNVVGEVINIGPDEETITIMELAERVANQLQFNCNPIHMAGRPQEVEHASCSSNKARKLLQYKTSVDLDTGIAKMIEAIRRRGTRDFKYHIDLEIVNEKTPRTLEGAPLLIRFNSRLWRPRYRASAGRRSTRSHCDGKGVSVPKLVTHYWNREPPKASLRHGVLVATTRSRIWSVNQSRHTRLHGLRNSPDINIATPMPG